MELYPIFVVWLACVTNKVTYQAVIANRNGEQQAIADKAGVDVTDVRSMVNGLGVTDGAHPVPEGEDSFVQQIGGLFQDFAIMHAGYHPGGSGEACGTVPEILDAIGRPASAHAQSRREQAVDLPTAGA